MVVMVILGDNLNDFESLLENNKDICSHYKNTQYIMIEIFKIKNELAHWFTRCTALHYTTLHYTTLHYSHCMLQLSLLKVLSATVVAKERACTSIFNACFEIKMLTPNILFKFHGDSDKYIFLSCLTVFLEFME